MQLYACRFTATAQAVGTLVLAHEASYIDTQVSNTLRSSLLTALVQTLFISGLALILVRWTLTGPLTRTANWLRGLRTGQSGQLDPPPALPQGELFDQIHREVTHLARDLNAARATAEEEARLRESNVSLWTAERLRVALPANCRTNRSSLSRTASPTCTSARTTARSRSSCRRAVW